MVGKAGGAEAGFGGEHVLNSIGLFGEYGLEGMEGRSDRGVGGEGVGRTRDDFVTLACNEGPDRDACIGFDECRQNAFEVDGVRDARWIPGSGEFGLEDGARGKERDDATRSACADEAAVLMRGDFARREKFGEFACATRGGHVESGDLSECRRGERFTGVIDRGRLEAG